MTWGILVFQGKEIIGKEVYCGDLSCVQESLSLRRKNDPTISFKMYDDANDPEFISIQTVPQKSVDQIAYANLKDDASRLDFIARKMGFL